MTGSMFETIVALPLFRGISEKQLMQVLEQCKIRFESAKAGRVILNAGEQCTHLTFVVSGIVRATTTTTDGRLSLSQSVKGPDVLYPDFLFGISTARPAVVRSMSEVVMLHVAKSDLIKVLTTNYVVLFNYLNILSSNAQRGYRDVFNGSGGDISRRLATRICALTKPNSFDIVLEINTNVATEFDTSIEAFNNAFNSLVEQKAVSGTPNRIVVKNRAALAALL